MGNEGKDQYILDNMNLVKYLASKYYTKSLGIEYEDLVSYGTIGLIHAASTFCDDRNCKFSTYASLKIRAAIIDEIRKQSPISRNDVAKVSEYNSAVEILQNKLLREPTDEEIAKYLKVNINDIKKIEKVINVMTTTSLDTIIFEGSNEVSVMDTIKEDDRYSPAVIVEEDEKLEVLTRAIDTLKEKDKLILSLYYYEELTLKEIGRVLEVSESRVSQLHSRAIINLRNAIGKLNYNIA